MNRRTWVAGAAGVGLAGVAGSALFRAWRSESAAEQAVRSERETGFTARTLDASLPAGFESVSTPADFRAVIEAGGATWIAAAGALFRYKSDGAVDRRWRCGFELPAAPLVALAADGPRLWVGTDGEGWVLVEPSGLTQIRPAEARRRRVRALLVLASGGLLVGTDQAGLLRYDGRTLTPFHPSLAAAEVTALAGTEESLWIGTRESGLWWFHSGQLDRFGEAEGLPDAHVHTVAAAGDVAVAGTPLGAASFRAGKLERPLAPGYFVRSAALRDGRFYAGTLEDGVLDLPYLSPSARVSPPAQRREIRQVAVTPGGSVQALTPRSLLSVGRSGAEEVLIEAPDSLLTDGNISALAMDPAGRLWIGYFDRGLDILDPAGRVTHLETDRLFCINRIVHAAGRTLVATANGLVIFDGAGRQRQVLTRAEGLLANHVTDVVPGSGEAFTAATPAGLTFFDTGGARSVNAFHGLVNNHVYSLAQKKDQLYAGTLGGISLVEEGAPRLRYTTANSPLSANWVPALAVAGDDLFIGTYGKGVQRLDAHRAWQSFPDLPAEAVVNPGAMLTTAQGVYAGTLADGLLFYDRAALRWRQIVRGLPSRNVTALAAVEGRLYAGTENGLVRIAESLLRV